MRNQKKGISVAIGVALFTVVLMLFQFFYIGIILKNEAEKSSKELASQTAQKIANSIEVYFRDALSVTQTYSQNFLVYKQIKLPRQTTYDLMRGSLLLSNNFLAIWTMWEPNAYDNNDKKYRNDSIHDPNGSFAIAYYFEGNIIKREVNDTSDFYEDFYTLPKKYNQPVILDPFYYQYHGNLKTFFETSLVTPIIENNKFMGVIGIDIDLYDLQSKYSKTKVYDDGFISLISNSGIIVTHKFPKYIEKNISEYTINENTSITDSLKSGKEFTTESHSISSDETVVRYYYPININYMAAPWYVMVEIPKRKILEQTNSLQTISTIFLISFLILLLYLFFNIADRNSREKKLLDNIERVKQAEKHIKESEEKYKYLLEHMNEVLMMVDNDDKILFVNTRFTELLGYTPDEVIGEIGYEKLLDPEDHNLIIEENKKRIHKEFSQYELSFRAKDGRKIDFLVSGCPMIDSEGKTIGSIGTMTDITERKKVERELATYQNHLEILVKARTEELDAINEELNITNAELYEQREALQTSINQLHDTQRRLIESEKMASLGVLSAGIAHEINNPLNFINGGALFLETYIKENLPEKYETVKPVIEGIHTGVNRASLIVKSLSQYSRSDEMPYSQCNLHEIIDDSLVMLHNQFKNKIDLQKHYTDEIFSFMGNEGKLHQAFLNILDNAGQAIEKNGKVTINTKIVYDHIHIEIIDTGNGITPENLKKIFDPFFTTKEPGKGTGLGLSITYNIIREHKGTIEFESQPEKGTKVIIKFPLKTNES